MNIIEFVRILKERELSPEKIEIAEWRSWTLVSCYSEVSSNFISESVAMGIDKDPHVALAKALTEFLERKLSKESSDSVVRLTERSDGFAAFPVYQSEVESKFRAAKNALNEAVERFVWASWWDDAVVSFKKTTLNLPEEIWLKSEFGIKSLSEIIVPTNTDIKLAIILAENEAGGFITGGAAGNAEQKNETMSRAFGELLRHLIVINKMKNSERVDLSFYEKRLWGFASGEWSELVHKRLSAKSDRILSLPHLIADQPISHNHSDLVAIHRCLFKNQPTFIGGPLERLCI